MKGLKRTLLALGVAGLPAAALADIQLLDDRTMGNITGQAGVTIELETKLNIDRFIYTDEGSLMIDDIQIGGANRTDLFAELGTNMTNMPASDLLDNIRINIDVLADGDAVINILPNTFGAVDFRISTGAWQLAGTQDSTLVLDNFQMDGLLGSGTIRVDTLTDTMGVRTDFAIDRMDFDVPFLALGIRDLSLTGAGYDLSAPQPLDLFARVNLDIYKAPNAAGVESLAIDLHEFSADVGIGGVLVGGVSVGSVFMDDLVISNTHMLVYGH